MIKSVIRRDRIVTFFSDSGMFYYFVIPIFTFVLISSVIRRRFIKYVLSNWIIVVYKFVIRYYNVLLN